MKMKIKFDLLKIGVFLLGISGIIISLLAYDIYSTSKERGEYYKKPFYAHCSEKAIIINARETLENIEILDNQAQVICNFDKILAGSEELCFVDVFGFYVVQAEDRKDVVKCREWAIPPIPEKIISPVSD